MTKNFILTTLAGIFIIYGCSQKAQQSVAVENFSGESFMVTDTVANVKCTQSGGKIDQNVCFCPSNHKQDENGFCVADE